jgi:hypothetical protein
MPCMAFVHSNRFSHCVITNTVRFLFNIDSGRCVLCITDIFFCHHIDGMAQRLGCPSSVTYTIGHALFSSCASWQRIQCQTLPSQSSLACVKAVGQLWHSYRQSTQYMNGEQACHWHDRGLHRVIDRPLDQVVLVHHSGWLL